jgi:protein SCO1/2
MKRALLAISWLLFFVLPAHADIDWSNAASVTPQLGATVPAGLVFTDETGATVRLADYLGTTPIFLLPVYYRCPNLCGATMEGLFGALSQLPLAAGRDYSVVAFSIDPRETPQIARAEREKYAAEFPALFGNGATGVHFLTSTAASSAALAKALGFRYTFDPATGQYAHDIEIVTLTPNGTIAAYAPTMAPAPADLRASLDEARKGIIARNVDRLIIFCCHLLPAVGRNTPIVERVLQGAAAATTLALGAMLWSLHRRRNGPRA